MKASVGQASRQAVQVPQRSSAGSAGVSSSEVRMTPRKSHEPSCWLMMQVFLAIQPMPAYLA